MIEDGSPTEEAQTSDGGGIVAAVDSVAPEGWRLKMAKVVAQLIVGTERGSEVYGEIRERLDTIEGRSLITKAMSNAIAQQAVGDPDMLERYKARFLGAGLRKQENLEAVIAGAEERVRAAEEEGLASTAASYGEAAEGEAGLNDQSAPLNPDWATIFTSYAENASTPELRERLSKVLAGEIARVGSFPRSTLRAIAELEQADLQALQALLPYCISDTIFRGSVNGTEIPTYDQLLPLVDAGLVADANPLIARTWPAGPVGGGNMMVAGVDWGLLVFVKEGQVLSLSTAKLSRAGLAVADMIGRSSEREVLRYVAKLIPEHVYDRVSLGRLRADQALYDLEQIMPPIAPASWQGLYRA